MTDRRSDGFHSGTRLDRARGTLRDLVAPHGRTERLELAEAGGRALASPIAARADAPRHARAALDGFAVRACDTRGAAEDDPVTLELTEGSVPPGGTVRVHTGSEIPDGADAVVRIERATAREGAVTVARPVPEGTNVAPAGEDVRAGQHLYDPGHRLRPSDLGLLKSAGVREVVAHERPRVSVLPTGEELVDSDPEPGEAVETNGLTTARLVEAWGGDPNLRGPVADDAGALRRAIVDAADADVVVTIGGSSVGERDLVPEVVDAVGDLAVHGVSIKPGHPVGLGRVEGTPTVLLPGYPVSCIINAVQFLRPALAWSVEARPKPLPRVRATLAEPVEGSPGVRRFARVCLRRDGPGGGGRELDADPGRRQEDDGPVAVPTTGSGAGVLSSVALADGWVEVPEDEGDLPAGSTVAVQDWEWHP